MKLFLKYMVLVSIAISIGSHDVYAKNNDGERYANTSVLNTPGTWIKLKVSENAIYKLTYKEIQDFGIDPTKAKIYGYGGWILDEDFRNPYIDDLPEVACWRSGTDANGFLLFYGRGTVKWSYNSTRKEYIHENNPYSTYGVYFLTDATSGEPKRMELKDFAASATNTLTYFDDYMVHEKEEYSVGKIGRELYGENFSGRNIQNFPFTIPGILNEKNGSMSVSFVSTSSDSHSLTLSIDGVDYIKTAMSGVSGSYTKGTQREIQITNWGENSNKNENTVVRINFEGGIKSAYLDYIRLNMQRKLQSYNTGYTFFRNSESIGKSVRYSIANAADMLVFDITDNFDTKRVQTKSSNNSLIFDTNEATLREFVLVDPKQSFLTPQSLGKLEATQNLHGLEQVEMVIISPKLYTSEAERLAQKHRDHSGLKVIVVNPDQIYNEFSSGTPDASAYRRFMKMFYDRGVTDSSLMPKYLLLFGDGMFDNRFIDYTCKGFNKDNFLLTYQVKESLRSAAAHSYSSDDYFGFLNETEDGKDNRYKTLMLGIGRFPVQNLVNAENAVNKTIAYMENKDYKGNDNRGIWKNSIVFLADDADDSKRGTYPNPPSKGNSHITQADEIADNIQKNFSEYMVTKIYMDAYQPEVTGGKITYNNSAKIDLNKALKDGCLILNYTGHGSTSGLAENIINLSDVQKMDIKHLPLWITATCDFSWFDATSVSIGEHVFLNEKGGGIALFSASRPVYGNENQQLHKKLIANLFKEGSRPTLGDVIRDSKNELSETDYNKMCYLLIGDPALKLNYPEPQIEVDKIIINGEENIVSNGEQVRLKALDEVTVSGHIKGNDNFNGELTANIFDGLQTIKSISKSDPDDAGVSLHFYFTDYPNKISQMHTKVENGKFEFSFMVVSDIANIENLGKMNFYAYDNTNTFVEANGSFTNYYMYGVNENADFGSLSSPEIRKMYLNVESFKSGDTVNETPFFVAEIADLLGINMSSAGMGHNIEIIINNTQNYSLNSYFTAFRDEKNAGIVKFSIPPLPEGQHTLKFQVWNVLNNVTIETIDFTVEKGLKPRLYDLTVRPNPVRAGTEARFAFNHNRPNAQLEVDITVFDMSGRPVWKHKQSGSSELMEEYEVLWDLKTNNGSEIQPGVYLYSATVRSEGSFETTKAKKMIVVGQ